MEALLDDNPHATEIKLLAASLCADETIFSTPYAKEGSGSNAEKLAMIRAQTSESFTVFDDVDYVSLAETEDAGGASQLLAYIADLRHQVIVKADELGLFNGSRIVYLSMLQRELGWAVKGRTLLSLHPIAYNAETQPQPRYM